MKNQIKSNFHNTLITILLFTLLLGLILFLSIIRNNQTIERQLSIKNQLDSVRTALDEVSEHVRFVDSIHYSKCGFVLRDGLLDDSGDN